MSTEKYPKYFKTSGQMQSGKLGPMLVSNGLIEVQNAEHETILNGLQTFKDGGIFQVGLKQTVEVLPNGGFKQIKVPNRFIDVFTEEEMMNINNIPDDVFEETVLFNIREIAKQWSEYGEPVVPGETGNDALPPAEIQTLKSLPAGSVETVDSFKTKKDLQERLEELGILYSGKDTKEKLFELYTQRKNGPPTDETA